jgi:hypothetical protein
VTRRLVAAAAAAAVAALLAAGLPTSDWRDRPAEALTGLSGVRSAVAGVHAERQSTVLAGEDRRLLTLVGSVHQGSGPYLQDSEDGQTLVLTEGGLPYRLADLVALGGARIEPDGSVLVTRHVFVAPGARLSIEAPGTTLRLLSQQSGFTSLVAWKADLTLSGADGNRLTVTSWDPGRNGPDPSAVDGRAYIREIGGAMELRHVAAADLGFWAGRTSGVAWTGSSRTAATGAVIDSTFLRNHYGAFASQSEGLTVADSNFSANTVDGLSLHRSTAATTIQNSTARDNGRHGFSADQGSQSVSFTDVTAERNDAYGIYFSGTPLAAGQSAGGASLRTYGQVQITGGVVRENGRAGVRVVDGNEVAITGTRLTDNKDGIVLVDTAAPTKVARTTVTGGHRFGISVTGGSAVVTGNKLSGSETAIRVRSGAVAVTGNDVRGATAHAISVVGAADGSSLRGNTISGRGPSGLDMYRVDGDARIVQSGNRLEGWEQDRDNWTYWRTFVPNHPMLLLWVVVLGAPLFLHLRARQRRVAPGTRPYRDGMRPGRAPHRVAAGRHVTGGQA